MLKKLAILASWSLCLWVFFAFVTPWLVSMSPAWQHFDRVQEDLGLHSGALYYSDVPVTQESEDHVRQAVREGMEMRAAQRRR